MTTSANWETRHAPCGASTTLTNPTGRVGSAALATSNSGRKVGAFGVGLGFVGDGPQHDAWMVLVAGDEFADGLCAHGLGGVVHRVGREGDVALSAEDSAAEPHVESDGGGLVDDEDAVPVGVVQDVLGVG